MLLLLGSEQTPVEAQTAGKVAFWKLLAKLKSSRVEQSESQAKKESKVGNQHQEEEQPAHHRRESEILARPVERRRIVSVAEEEEPGED